MPYMIETWDKPDHQPLRKQTRDEHLQFLATHAARLLACGAKLNDDGSDAGGGIYIVDVDTRAAAEEFIATDPFSRVDLFAQVRITRWRKAYVAGQNFL
ncbi:YciI family protein [Actimicrobium sp. CCI2.3]|uniref:YciI family protein n=1 Tax=Actimicrobium sp. CCI2.3 TaxID=3048616 RepID=UPI002AB5D62C|nr:YciI family protein [Actimicrobium sp. CCI2.3]MDY7574726.1 YciI family protein [Actimicrobium sp. CCI2.3]MEB0020313.1 YciI family protein [Actimicrobium sp. CCI2.3]